MQQPGWDSQPPERPGQEALSASLGWVMGTCVSTVQHLERARARMRARVHWEHMFSLGWTRSTELWQPHPSWAAGSGPIFSPSTREERAFENLNTAHVSNKICFSHSNTVIIIFHSYLNSIPFPLFFHSDHFTPLYQSSLMTDISSTPFHFCPIPTSDFTGSFSISLLGPFSIFYNLTLIFLSMKFFL